MKKTALLILLVFTLFSCKKKTFVTIQAENYITGEGSAYAGAKYYVVESYTPLFQVKAKQVVSGTLDANGHAAFELKMDNNKIYDLRIAVPSNVCYTEMSTDIGVEREENNVINFKYAPGGYFNAQRNNIACEGPTDKFQYVFNVLGNPDIYIYTGFVSGADYHWTPTVFIEGCHSYLGDQSRLVPIGTYEIAWRVIRGTDTTYGADTFVIEENDTTTHLIEY